MMMDNNTTIQLNTTIPQTHVSEFPNQAVGYGPVRSHVGATDPTQGHRPGSVQVHQNISQEEVNTLSLRNQVPEQDSVYALTSEGPF
jgi:hypothetical protein